MDNQSQFPLMQESLNIPIENLLESQNLKEEFNCMICLGIVLKPLQLKCCDHLICTDCLKNYIRKCEVKPKCPLCKHSLTYSTPNKMIMRIYNNISVKCVKCEVVLKFEFFMCHFFNECNNRISEAKRFCRVCQDIYPSDADSHKCLIIKEIKESKLHDHLIKFTNNRKKHINYEKVGWICDYCESLKLPNEKSFHCHKCELDICEDCINYVKNRLPEQSLHMHPLRRDVAVDWVCNVCKVERDHSFAWSCAACDFDACIRCYWRLPGGDHQLNS